MNKKQIIEKYLNTPLKFLGYHKNSFSFGSDEIYVRCSPFYIYDFEMTNEETLASLLEYVDEPELTIILKNEESKEY